MENFTTENVITAYYYVAMFATVFFILKMVLFAFFGGDTEVHTDFNSSFETDDSFDFLSIQTILAFLMGYGWMGLTCMKVWGLRILVSAGIAFFFGLIMLFITAYLMYCVKKLNNVVKKDMTLAVGVVGRAYTHFEPKGSGQIEININEQLSIEEAVNVSDVEIKAFEEVKVVKFEDYKLYIEKV